MSRELHRARRWSRPGKPLGGLDLLPANGLGGLLTDRDGVDQGFGGVGEQKEARAGDAANPSSIIE